MKTISTGNKDVDRMGEMNITGNIISPAWYKKICFANGKPNWNAILILSEIVYWYRPTEERDEETGLVTGYRKKFRADMLQRNYSEFGDKLGLTKRQVKTAMDQLEELGLIQREFRTIKIGSQYLYNTLYIRLDAGRLYEITFGEDDPPENVQRHEKKQQESTKRLKSGDKTDRGVVHPEAGGPTAGCKTDTENTTKTSSGDKSYPIDRHDSREDAVSPPGDRIDRIDSYRAMIKKNLEYDVMMHDLKDDSDRKRFQEIYELICDVVCREGGTIRIAGEDKPCNAVRSAFLELNQEHVKYVMDCLEKTTSQIGNMRNYLLTALYNSRQSFYNSINQQVNHDMYELEASGG